MVPGESIADRHRGKQRKGSRKNTDTSSCSLQQCLEHLLKKEILNENSRRYILHLFFISSSSLHHLFSISSSSLLHLLFISSSSHLLRLHLGFPTLEKFGFQLLLNIELCSFLCHHFIYSSSLSSLLLHLFLLLLLLFFHLLFITSS